MLRFYLCHCNLLHQWKKRADKHLELDSCFLLRLQYSFRFHIETSDGKKCPYYLKYICSSGMKRTMSLSKKIALFRMCKNEI